jgi:hypothetical protein
MAGDLSHVPEIVEKRRQVFLDLLASNGGNVLKAAMAVGYDDARAMQQYRLKDPEFARQWDEALMASNDVLEAHAIERATVGVEEPVYYQGEVVGTKRVASDGLLTTLLKARKPDTYSEKREVRGSINHNVKVGVAIIPMLAPTNEDWERTAIAHETPLALPAPAETDKDKA